MFDIEENLKKLPDSPGVYIHRDASGEIIYVGKAVSLKNRVRQYFRGRKNMDDKVRAMADNIASFEYITCDNEMEALILECNLIKKYRPRYNILLRDDKTYPYIKVTLAERYPRILKTRLIENDGSRYFGPYSDAGAVRHIVDFLDRTYMLKQCAASSFPRGHRPCLNYHIQACRGICNGTVSEDEYRKTIDDCVSFLNGNSRPLRNEQMRLMEEASAAMDYEKAAVYRDNIRALDAVSEKQRVVLRSDDDMDIILLLSGEEAVLFYIRGGRLTGREVIAVSTGAHEREEDILSSFIRQYYSGLTRGPAEIILDLDLPDKDMLEAYLARLWGRKTALIRPRRGEKKALLDLAKNDMEQMRRTRGLPAKKEEELRHAIDRLCALKSDKEHGYRAEAYDISDMNGLDSVGAMVVFDGGSKRKKDYRRFRIRTVDGPDDYASIQEVLYRRLKRAADGDSAFGALPDLLLIDGGRGHVHAADEVVRAMGMDIPVFGMAKDDSHRTSELVYEKDGSYHSVDLKEEPVLFRYLGTVQEEVHRFAVEYHRGLRAKKMTGSRLDEIKGIGPVKRNSLLAAFGSVEKISRAGREELMTVEGISGRDADNILEYFN